VIESRKFEEVVGEGLGPPLEPDSKVHPI